MAHLLLFLIYLTFISLGLPDSLLGSAWPVMHQDLKIPVYYAGIITAIICMFTILASLLSAKLTKKVGTGIVVVFSVFLTAFALLGFSLSNKFYMLIIFAIPYGFGAGGIDAAINNYAALNYKAKHMSWLHAMWGVGTIVGPYAMGYALTNNLPWNNGYLYISIIQFSLLVILIFSLPLWNKGKKEEKQEMKVLSLKEILNIKGIIILLVVFFSYCALEQTSILWASSYLVENNNIDVNVAATLASLFCIGITVGRFISGFIAIKLKDKDMIRLGLSVISLGIILLAINISNITSCIGFVLIGLGCAPIYPSVIHSTPIYFGKDISQSLIGVQMAGAYIGTLLMPPLFGVIADFISVKLLPFYLLIFLMVMFVGHEILLKKLNVVQKNLY